MVLNTIEDRRVPTNGVKQEGGRPAKKRVEPQAGTTGDGVSRGSIGWSGLSDGGNNGGGEIDHAQMIFHRWGPRGWGQPSVGGLSDGGDSDGGDVDINTMVAAAVPVLGGVEGWSATLRRTSWLTC